MRAVRVFADVAVVAGIADTVSMLRADGADEIVDLTRWPNTAGWKGCRAGLMAELGRSEDIVVDLLRDAVIGVHETGDAARGE